MDCTALHFELHVRDLEAARRFYVDQLGFPVLQETAAMKLLAVRVGGSRMTVFGDRTDQAGPGPSQIILAVADLDAAIIDLEARGVELDGAPIAAGTFLRFVTARDPDGDIVALSQYLRDPIAPI